MQPLVFVVPRPGLAVAGSLPVGRFTYPTSPGHLTNEALLNLWITRANRLWGFYDRGHDDDPPWKAFAVIAVSRWASVFQAHKASKSVVSVTTVSHHTWHLHVTRVGSDYAAGDTAWGASKSVVFLYKNIEAVTSFEPRVARVPVPGVASNFLAMVENLSRLSKKVVLHTTAHQWAGVIRAVDVDHLTVVSHTGHRVVVSLASISWIAVEASSGVDNP